MSLKDQFDKSVDKLDKHTNSGRTIVSYSLPSNSANLPTPIIKQEISLPKTYTTK